MGDADDLRYQSVLTELSAIKGIGAVLAIVTPQAQTDIEKISLALAKDNQKYSFPVIPLVIGSEAAKTAVETFRSQAVSTKRLATGAISNFIYPSMAVQALSGMVKLTLDRSAKTTRPKKLPVDKARQKKVSEIFRKAQADKRGVLLYPEAVKLAGLYGIDALRSFDASDFKSLGRLGCVFPVVLKIDSENVLHKNAKGGLVLNIQNKLSWKRPTRNSAKASRPSGFLSRTS